MIKNKILIPYDFFANFVVKALLKKRDAKPIFSSAELAVKELERISQENRDKFSVPENVTFKNEIETMQLGTFPLLKITPKNSKRCNKTVIYLHGGAFVNEPTDWHFTLCDKLVSFSGCTLLMFIYPKAPTHDYKLAYKLVEELYASLLEKNKPEDIVFMGDSAGATMSLCLCHIFKEKSVPVPGQLILYSPVCDTRLRHEDIKKIFPKDPMQGVDGLKKYAEAWGGAEVYTSPKLNPALIDFTALPKTTIFAGKCEIFNPEVNEFVKNAEKSCIEIDLFQYSGMFHCFPLFKLCASGLARLRSAKLIRGE